MTVVSVIGAQWGDEGKGKVVDIFAEWAEMVVRYQGGNNAGHTLVVGGQKTIFHLIPSGILRENARCVLAQGLVVDLKVLTDEIDKLDESGLLAKASLHISDHAHVILPYHLTLDRIREEDRSGAVPIGSTRRGIGPCYEDKIGRRGIRIGDLYQPERLAELLESSLAYWRPMLAARGETAPSIADVTAYLAPLAERIRPFVTDTVALVHDALDEDVPTLLEGAQGVMLDIDHGTYPFVTSSNTIAGAACTGIGVGPTAIDEVVLIAKAYTTRVGSGPFPTELSDATGDCIREVGAEFGSTTGRPRRCGWFDAVVSRHAARVCGGTWLAITKLDVLSGLDEVRICTGYRLDGREINAIPLHGLDRVEPIYRTMPGWKEDITGVRDAAQLPQAAKDYLNEIERLTGCPICLISVGPGREQTILTHNPFDT